MNRFMIALLAAGMLAGRARAQAPEAARDARPAAAVDDLARRARAVLDAVLATEKSWIKVHAAEVLVADGQAGRLHRLFLAQLAESDASDYRVGGWRVLAATSPTAAERARWVARIEGVLLDPGAPDHSQAVESLGKLQWKIAGRTLAAVRALAATAPAADTLMPLWALAIAGEPGAPERLVAALDSTDSTVRQRAAYALRWLKPEAPTVRRALARAADREPAAAPSYAFVLGAAFVTEADPGRMAAWRSGLERVLAAGAPGARFEAAQALKQESKPGDLARVAPLLDSPESDVRVAGAAVILQVRRRG